MKRMAEAAAVAALVVAAGLAQAQTEATGHGADGSHDGHSMGATAGSPAEAAFRAANERMHAAMDIRFTGNADVDFARGMIGHHRGAVEMAQILIEHGSDPELVALAEAIIAAQEAEIAFLEEWLATQEE